MYKNINRLKQHAIRQAHGSKEGDHAIMAGFSDVTDGDITQYKARLTQAGYTAEMIRRVAKDPLGTSARGHVALMRARHWLTEDVIRLHQPEISVEDIPGVKVRYKLLGSDRYLYSRQWYGNPSDYGDGPVVLLEEFGDDRAKAFAAPFERFTVSEDEWLPLIPGWEVKGQFMSPQLLLVRRIPDPGRWIELADEWEARFTADRNFELRPALAG